MKSVAVLLGLIALPFTYVAQSADIADVSTNYLEQLYDINMEDEHYIIEVLHTMFYCILTSFCAA